MASRTTSYCINHLFLDIQKVASSILSPLGIPQARFIPWRNAAGSASFTTAQYELILKLIFNKNESFYIEGAHHSTRIALNTIQVFLMQISSLQTSVIRQLARFGTIRQAIGLNAEHSNGQGTRPLITKIRIPLDSSLFSACLSAALYSSAGLFGFYPWIDRSNGYYAILGRMGTTISNAAQLSLELGGRLQKSIVNTLEEV